jgi:hypothetical protein
MIRALFAAVLSVTVATVSQAASMPSFKTEGLPAAPVTWRAPNKQPVDLVRLAAPTQEKLATIAKARPGVPMQVGVNQDLDAATSVSSWSAVPGGFVATVRVTSANAVGLRVRLELGTVPGAFELRAQGSDASVIESMPVDPTLGNTHWTPYTEGQSQVIELFSPVLPSPGAISVSSVSYFTQSILAPKAGAASCTVSVQCSTNDATLDAAIANTKASIVKINFVTTKGAFLCTATLLNNTNNPIAPFLLTANHCVSDPNAAATVTSIWFYDPVGCQDTSAGPSTQVAGGTTLTFTNYNVDSTLLKLNRSPPGGAVYSAWNSAAVANGTSIVSLSHPQGDATRLAQGKVANQFRIDDWPYDMYGITFTNGIIEEGSSGSGLFVMNNGTLELRGSLTGSTVQNGSGGLSCTDLNEYGLYDRFEVFEPEIDQFLKPQARTDDEPNMLFTYFGTPNTDTPLDQLGSPLVLNRNIDYPGDVDVFRFSIAATSSVHVWTTGTMDTVGTLFDSTGAEIAASDDENADSTNMGMTQTLSAGTYYVAVGDWVPQGTGAYTLNMTAGSSSVTYTDLWWNAAESGWGLNVNHQGNVIFATLFDYDANGKPLWLVLANGAKQSDGSFTGDLFRTTGPAFNASPFNPSAVVSTKVGTMTLAFDTASTGTLTYSVNGTNVTKRITRQVFSTPATCSFTTGDRSTATNYQDLWWNPNESGWGINVTHQGDVIFATLFDYDLNGNGTWYVLANAPKVSAGVYSGALYTTTDPPFNANPWVPNSSAATQVGTMSFTFSSGNAGTLTYTVNGAQVTKQIQREVFSSPTTQCQ